MRYLFFILALLCSCSATKIHTPIYKPETNANMYDSVGVVYVKQHGDTLMTGTAFAVDTTRLVTALHVCLSYINKTAVEGLDLQLTVNDTPVFIQKVSLTQDLCMLSGDHNLIPVSISDQTTKPGDEIVIIGAPLGIGITESNGHVISNNYVGIYDFMLGRLVIHAPTVGGFSGSPVFSNGKVIGVLVAGLNNYGYISICVGLDHLRQFLMH